MGKSDKKVKSDRINALRKQYDAFLEEDKKRKERNEFILGRLDLMRSSTALVLHRRVPCVSNLITETSGHFNRENILKEKEHELKSRRNLSLIPMAQATSIKVEILRKISQHYILIPKLGLRVQEEGSNLSDEKDSDWKSKYDILVQLKQNEIESDDPIIGKQEHLRTEQENANFSDRNYTERPNNKRRMSIFPNDKPERDLNTSNKVQFEETYKYDPAEETHINSKPYEETTFNNTGQIYSSEYTHEQVYNKNRSNIQEEAYKHSLDYDPDKDYLEKSRNYDNKAMQDEIMTQEIYHPEVYDGRNQNYLATNTETVKNNFNDENSTLKIKQDKMHEKVFDDTAIRNKADDDDIKQEGHGYAKETKQIKDINISPDKKSITPNEIELKQTLYVQERVLENKHEPTLKEHQEYSKSTDGIQGSIDPIANADGTVTGRIPEIEVVNQNNNEIYNQEQPNKKYQDFNQDAKGELYTAEYPAEQAEYDLNGQYQGYANIQPEQKYPSEYVANEITEQHYDPSHEQQNGTAQYYQEQQEYYEQQPGELDQQPGQYEQPEVQQPEQYLQEPEQFDQQQLQYEQQQAEYEQQADGIVQQPEQYEQQEVQQPEQYLQEPEQFDQQQLQYEQQAEYEQQADGIVQQPEQYEQQEVQQPEQYLQEPEQFDQQQLQYEQQQAEYEQQADGIVQQPEQYEQQVQQPEQYLQETAQFDQQQLQYEQQQAEYEQQPDGIVQQPEQYEQQVQQPEQYLQEPAQFDQQQLQYEQQQAEYELQADGIVQQPEQYEQQVQQPEQYLQEPAQFDQQQLQYEQQQAEYQQQADGIVQQPEQYQQEPNQFVQQSGQYEQQQGAYDQQHDVDEQNTELYEQQYQHPEQFEQQPVYEEQLQEYHQQNVTENLPEKIDTENGLNEINQSTTA